MIKSLKLLSILILYSFIDCSSSLNKDNFSLIHRMDDIIILKKQNSASQSNLFPIQKSNLRDFFLNLFYSKNNNLYSDRKFLINDDIADKILDKIFEELKVGNIIYIIYKREDPIAPYTRIYRTIFNIQISSERITVEFIEIDKNIIFGNQYLYSDWASFRDDSECNYKNNVFLAKNLDFVNVIQSELCKKNLYNSFQLYISPISQPVKKGDSNAEDKLNELNNLYKNGLINETEYNRLRNKILDNF